MLVHGAGFIQIVAVRDHYLSAAFSSLWLIIKGTIPLWSDYRFEIVSQFFFGRSRESRFAKYVIFLADLSCKRKNFTQSAVRITQKYMQDTLR